LEISVAPTTATLPRMSERLKMETWTHVIAGDLARWTD
jgi:hypothetical protein